MFATDYFSWEQVKFRCPPCSRKNILPLLDGRICSCFKGNYLESKQEEGQLKWLLPHICCKMVCLVAVVSVLITFYFVHAFCLNSIVVTKNGE